MRPAEMAQDESAEFSKWLSTKPHARALVDERCDQIKAEEYAREQMAPVGMDDSGPVDAAGTYEG